MLSDDTRRSSSENTTQLVKQYNANLITWNY